MYIYLMNFTAVMLERSRQTSKKTRACEVLLCKWLGLTPRLVPDLLQKMLWGCDCVAVSQFCQQVTAVVEFCSFQNSTRKNDECVWSKGETTWHWLFHCRSERKLMRTTYPTLNGWQGSTPHYCDVDAGGWNNFITLFFFYQNYYYLNQLIRSYNLYMHIFELVCQRVLYHRLKGKFKIIGRKWIP